MDGGVIKFAFDPPVDYVKDIGLLDVDYSTDIKIKYLDEDGVTTRKKISVPILGDNSYQLLPLDVGYRTCGILVSDHDAICWSFFIDILLPSSDGTCSNSCSRADSCW